MKSLYRTALIIASVLVTYLYATAPPARNFAEPESAKILFFHAPEAMLCTVFFLWGAIMAGRYLRTRDIAFDIRSLASIEMGTLLCLLATATGMVFAYEQWGVAWDWDFRQVSIFIQLLIYAAYFALRAGFSSRERAAANAGAYSIFAFLTVPFLIWVLPRLPQFATKHAGANQAVTGGGLDSTYRAIFYSCAVVIGLVALYCYKLRVREAEAFAHSEKFDVIQDSSFDSTSAGVVRPVRLRDTD
ncbi:MAG: cytochrome c biogenesis protein CcsA [Fimbriimonadales bacterium]